MVVKRDGRFVAVKVRDLTAEERAALEPILFTPARQSAPPQYPASAVPQRKAS